MTEPNKPHEPMSAQERLDLGMSHYREGRFDEAIKTWSTIRREEADPETYADAQLNLGDTYKDQRKLNEAITAWSSIRRDDNSEAYAWAQLKLGVAYYTQRKLNEAITAWSSIRRDDNSEAYAWAQLKLGDIYESLDKRDKAINIWSNIHRNDSPKAYAQAQLALGSVNHTQNRVDKAITACSNIRCEDDPAIYAQAQFNLGNIYKDLENLDKAIAAWSNVRYEDNRKTYSGAQLNLGSAYKVQGNRDKAITTWLKIRHDDSPETYAKAQLSLGFAYHAQNEMDKAITTWLKIRHDDSPETYAKAQLSLGKTYEDQGKLDEAISGWKKVHRNDDSEAYVWAQLSLGVAYYTQRKLNEAITAWSNIHPDDNPKVYAWAQLNLGLAYIVWNEMAEAIGAWLKVDFSDSPEAYLEAQLCLGEVYSLDKNKKEQAHEAYDNVREFFYYKSERGFKILKCPVELRKELHGLAKNTDKVLKYLQIIPGFESKVAHYTRPQIAFDLFEGKKNDNDKEPSNFRLSTIRGVNDPTEGLVLNGYWNQQGIPETIHTNDTATFISCFTFNHDNLNQFRLYGKENGREATGVSLVFNKEFFSNQADTLEFIAGPSIGPSRKSEQSNSNKTGKMGDGNKKKLIGKSTLYRCIYLDPETGYLTLAQRDKSTFYRENKKAAKDQWNEYSTKISGIKGSVKNCLFDDNNSVLSMLKSISEELEESNAPEESHTYSIEEKQKILEAIRFILLPLQYLVKHIAFQEEQECRIMYITQFRDEKIHSDREKQWMYVEYEEPVLPHIDKIWLSPGAAKDQDFFRILLDQKEDDNKSKVRISQNPFRNKE